MSHVHLCCSDAQDVGGQRHPFVCSASGAAGPVGRAGTLSRRPRPPDGTTVIAEEDVLTSSLCGDSGTYSLATGLK